MNAAMADKVTPSRYLEPTSPPEDFAAAGCTEQCVRLVLPNNRRAGVLSMISNCWFSKEVIREGLQAYYEVGVISAETVEAVQREVDASDLPEAMTAWERIYLMWIPGYQIELKNKEKEKAKERRAAEAAATRAWRENEGSEAELQGRLRLHYGHRDLNTATLVRNEDGTFTFAVEGASEVLPTSEIAHNFVHILAKTLDVPKEIVDELHSAFRGSIREGMNSLTEALRGLGLNATVIEVPSRRGGTSSLDDLLAQAGRLNGLPSDLDLGDLDGFDDLSLGDDRFRRI